MAVLRSRFVPPMFAYRRVYCLHNRSMSDSQKVIIVFKEGATDADKEAIKNSITTQGGSLGDTLELINGISAVIPNSFSASLTGHSAIDSVENDGVVTTQ
ncbi:hypothetical protein FBU59_002421 [Linderina macrospora]|uniref:Uncharacterized protein n=1 Tax=Linderina macrospora TaxID=4868 RepID=A0ACC1JBI1_9FUNG|nr:hypothetical protein FBU59_002421 [Linderina macrospora]